MSDNGRRGPLSWPAKVRGLNFFDTDRNLEAVLTRLAPDMLSRRRQVLHDLGSFASGRLDVQATESDQDFQPVLKDIPDSFTRPTGRQAELRLNGEYEDCQQELYRRALIAACFDRQNPESHLLPFTAAYLIGQTDISTGCPFAMTHPVAFVLDRLAPADIKKRFLPEVLRTDGKTAVCGTWATERHSGSDVGGSVTRAVKEGDESGVFRLFGHNWFTSAFGFRKFIGIKTARPDGAPEGSKGIGLYLVPGCIDGNWETPNNYTITHLKRKLGTRALPTVEVNLEGALAYEIAPPGKGLKTMMSALGCSRVHNAVIAAGFMRRAYVEALCWASSRETFGKKLIERPMVQKRILEIGVEWLAGTALSFEAARSFDEAARDPAKESWMRLMTALAKFKTADRAVWCAQKALELVGGNGYTEDYPVARQFRDAMVLPVWEGPEQIQALELMRMITGKASGDREFITRLKAIGNGLPASMAVHKSRLAAMTSEMDAALIQLRQTSEQATEAVADQFLHKMADLISYGLLCEEASWELAHRNDSQKSLAAEFFHGRHFTVSAVPSFAGDDLHKYFDQFVSGLPIELGSLG